MLGNCRFWAKRDETKFENAAKKRLFKPLTLTGRSVLLHPVSVGKPTPVRDAFRVGFFILGLAISVDMPRMTSFRFAL
jgi:hypothetical protein